MSNPRITYSGGILPARTLNYIQGEDLTLEVVLSSIDATGGEIVFGFRFPKGKTIVTKVAGATAGTVHSLTLSQLTTVMMQGNYTWDAFYVNSLGDRTKLIQNSPLVGIEAVGPDGEYAPSTVITEEIQQAIATAEAYTDTEIAGVTTTSIGAATAAQGAKADTAAQRTAVTNSDSVYGPAESAVLYNLTILAGRAGTQTIALPDITASNVAPVVKVIANHASVSSTNTITVTGTGITEANVLTVKGMVGIFTWAATGWTVE